MTLSHASSCWPRTAPWPLWSLSRWSDLHPSTSFTCVSLVPFGVWRYCAGTRYGSPDSPAICLWSSSSLLLWVPKLCSSTGSLLDYQNTWITHPAPPGHGGTSGIFSGYPSSPMHPLPMQRFYFCSNLGRVPTPAWGSPRDSPPHQLCGSWADIPQFPLILPHRSGGSTRVVSILPHCFSLRPPSHALREWEGRSLWAQPSSAEGLVCFCCSEKKLFCIS